MKDSEVLSFFTLPAEYAFVGRVLSQMGGVGKSLDPTFDFISSAAPWIYEVKGVKSFVKEEAKKWFSNLVEQICDLVPFAKPLKERRKQT
jgi:predicted unusual protein kinase regulating ubiquinone biosynthesis (AarF/ABC1/UbiB family)